MRRRRPQNADSLELLLDTLCNTFGGVLFIAMLVIVLLQVAGDGPSQTRVPVSSEELRELSDELEVIGRELESLAGNVPSGHSADPDPAAGTAGDVQARLAASLAQLDELRRRMDATLVETGRNDAEALSDEDAAVELKGRVARLDRDADDLRKQLDKERKASAWAVRTPVMHDTDKHSLMVELRYDRLYIVHRYGDSEKRLGPNLDDYVLLSNAGDAAEITADPSRGMPIVDGPTLAQSLHARLERFPPDGWFLDLAVRSGSFGSFHKLREAASSMRYEIRIVLVPEKHMFKDRGGSLRGVQ
jgi:hypothetical protein